MLYTNTNMYVLRMGACGTAGDKEFSRLLRHTLAYTEYVDQERGGQLKGKSHYTDRTTRSNALGEAWCVVQISKHMVGFLGGLKDGVGAGKYVGDIYAGPLGNSDKKKHFFFEHFSVLKREHGMA